MGVLKGLALSLFGFLLFLSLIIFGPGYTVNSTALNPDFISAEIDKIDVSSMVSEALSEELFEEASFPPELETAILRTVHEIEPVVKEQLKSAIRSLGDYIRGNKEDPELARVMSDTFLNAGFVASVLSKVDVAEISEPVLAEELPEEFAAALVKTIARHEAELKTQMATASGPIFAYLLEETASVDLAAILRDTVLSTEFVTTLLDELDISYLSSDFLLESIADSIPADVEIPTDRLEEAVDALGPSIKEAMTDNVDAVLDYLLGQVRTLDVTVSLEPVMEDLESVLREAFLDSAPAGWDQLPQDERDRQLDEFLDEATGALPSSFELDESMFGRGIPDHIAAALADAEDALAEARSGIADGISSAEEALEEPREYIGYFLSGYIGLLALMAVSALAIIALYHQVKGATLQLGITALTCGIIHLVAVVLGRNYATTMVAEQIAMGDMPRAIQGLPEMLITDFTAPLQTLSIGLIAGGIILIAVSIIYPRLRPGHSETEG